MTWPAQGMVQAGGKRLELACFGPPPTRAPTVVMLHEGLGCAALWRDLPQRLSVATGWGVCAYSRAGYGGSDPCDVPRPLDYMTHEAVEVLPEVLDAIGFQSGALLGHSDGASIAAIHAGRIRDPRVQALVLIAPHFFSEPMGLAAIRSARNAYEAGDLRCRLAKYHADVDCAFWGWNGAWLDRRFEAWNIADVLDDIVCPVLAIQGEDDPYGSLAQIEVISRRCTAAVPPLILPEIGHAPHVEDAQTTRERIVGFLMNCAL